MVRDPDKDWVNNAGVVCMRHRPEELPLEVFLPPGVFDRLEVESAPTPRRQPGPARAASNATVHTAMELNAKTEAQINAWVATQTGQDPHPVAWEWAPWETKRSLHNSSCDIVIEYSDGTRKIKLPSDLDLPATPEAPTLDGMQVTDLKPNLLVQTTAREVLKVGTVYNENKVSATVEYPLQPRTTVRFYTAAQVATWREPSTAMITKYERAQGFTTDSPCDP